MKVFDKKYPKVSAYTKVSRKSSPNVSAYMKVLRKSKRFHEYLCAKCKRFHEILLEITKFYDFQAFLRESVFKNFLLPLVLPPLIIVLYQESETAKDFQKSLDTAIAPMIQYYC